MSTPDHTDEPTEDEAPAYSSTEIMAPPAETIVTVEGWPDDDYCKINFTAGPGGGRVSGSLILTAAEARRVAGALLEEAEDMEESNV